MQGLNQQEIEKLGEQLDQALRMRTALEPLSDTHPGITLEEAYRIQQRMLALRMEHGERVIGKKIGVTSQAVMNMLGVQEPDFGVLLDGMARADGATIPIGTLIQPKAEGEIAFVLKDDLEGPGLTSADVLRATAGVMSCIEIVDSRIRDWKMQIQDTVADNASCGIFVLGDRLIDPRELDLRYCGMVMEKNGQIAVTGAGAATMGSPVNAVVWLANTLGKLGMPLKAGEVILSGALGAMLPLQGNEHLKVTIGGIGSCSVHFTQ